MSFPLACRERIMGAVTFYFRKALPLAENDTKIIYAVIARLGLVIENNFQYIEQENPYIFS